MDNQTPLTVDEAAEFTGFKKSYLYRLSSLGRIPVYRPNGGKIFFRRDELSEFIFRNRRTPDYELNDKADAVVAVVAAGGT